MVALAPAALYSHAISSRASHPSRGRVGHHLGSTRRVAVRPVRAAIEDEEELPRSKFQVRRLQPLPSDFGDTAAPAGKKRPIKKAAPITPTSDPSAGEPSAASPDKSPFDFATKPAKSPFAGGAAPAKPAGSPFAAGKQGAAAGGASPFASADKTGASKSPFAGAGKPASAASPFGEAARGGSQSPFSVNASDVANSMAPIDKKPQVKDEAPFWSKLPLPSANSLILVFTFGSIISLMLGTFYVVVQLGGVRLNE
eukprot:CAMPEP_0114247280 /NCGR_PEP_ID=MMETSP0058-20121206/12937_1 /TAXON_ID=36894 /ORGANISM="Pyramimonas parkeae, CCMP726" /LENGTH=254 /DNA_ID=CAMNT_0001360573 /DNA_START=127 /DNA_END=891 /DNA_ORIENTATION=+